jgi:CheY-like chemotaxis protein
LCTSFIRWLLSLYDPRGPKRLIDDLPCGVECSVGVADPCSGTSIALASRMHQVCQMEDHMRASTQTDTTAAQWAIPVAEDWVEERYGLHRGNYIPEALVAEDDEDMRMLIAQALREEGFNVLSSNSGWELLEHIGARMRTSQGRSLDLIVTDVRMPGITGLEILAGLRENDWSTPVILMTAFGDAELHAEAERLGVVAVLDKPFELDTLRKLVRQWVDR